jgi:hypothetical protein
MMIILLAALLAAPQQKAQAVQPQPTQPQLSDEEIRQRIQAYLGSIDTRITADQWKMLGPGAADILIPIAQSKTEMPSRRAHALSGLVLAAPDRAAKLAATLAQDDAAPTAVRVAALRGVERTSPASELSSKVAKVLRTARDPGVRRIAAEVMAGSGSSGCAEVKAQVAREQPGVRPAFGRALARCGE